MPDIWCPFAKRNEAPKHLWGIEQRADTGLLHSTESLDTFNPNPHNYFGHDGYPHFTVNSKGIWQHIPINRSARALLNKPGGVETNKSDVVQIEIAWRAEVIRAMPTATMENLRELMRWIEANSDVPRVSTVNWMPYPKSYGESAEQRLHGKAWLEYKGWLGHQHADENDHGDPGNIDIVWLLDKDEPEEPIQTTEVGEMWQVIKVSKQVADKNGQFTDTFMLSGSLLLPVLDPDLTKIATIAEWKTLSDGAAQILFDKML